MRATVIGIAVGACILAACQRDGNGVNKEAAQQVGFYETYQLGEIAEALTALSNEAAKHIATSDSMNLEQLLNTRNKTLPVWTAKGNGFAQTPVVGFALTSDTSLVNLIIARFGEKFLPKDLKLAWVFKPFKPNKYYKKPEIFELIALKASDTLGVPSMGGTTIISAVPDVDENSGHAVMLKFDESGKQQLAQLSKENLKRNIAFVVKDKVFCFPMVQSEITGGQVQLTGNFTEEEVTDFVNFLYGKQ